ncbi:MAG TPA: hypothetical protein VF805_11265 [Anaeromyxobacteraceae bacterium]
MPHDVECTHCHVLMTTWSAAGSPVRYWQCPFCNRTHSSLYSEVFQRGAGARRVEAAPPPGPAGVPQASADEIAWTRLKARAARWFARLEQEQLPAAVRPADRNAAATSPAVVASARRAR